MTPEINTIHQGDCLEVMRGWPDGFADAIIADPPYCAGAISETHRVSAKGQGLRSDTLSRFGWFRGDNMGTAGLQWLLRSVGVQASRILKETGSLLLFCDWRMLAMLSPAVESAGLRYQGLIVWDKGSMGLGTGFRNQHELIMHFTNGAPCYSDRSIANVIRCKRVSASAREHQTQKPVGLLQQLVRVTSPVGGLVLDPFAGSGSTLLAAQMEGRSYLGIELNQKYIDIANRRLAKARGPMFANRKDAEATQ